jgi:hypothetical protein
MKSLERRSPAVRNRTPPAFIEPMQCKPVTALPAGEKWAFELKLDGYRCIAVKHGKEVTLFSRHRKVLNRRFLGVVEALASLKGDFVLDGELVVLDPEGRLSFQLLQGATSGDPGARLRRQGKERVRAAGSRRALPGSGIPTNREVSVREPARDTGLTMGRDHNRREDVGMPADQTETSLPGRLR